MAMLEHMTSRSIQEVHLCLYLFRETKLMMNFPSFSTFLSLFFVIHLINNLILKDINFNYIKSHGEINLVYFDKILDDQLPFSRLRIWSICFPNLVYGQYVFPT